MLFVKGHIVSGVQDFRRRMTAFPEVFKEATGQDDLYPGTLNVRIDREIPIREDFRIRGTLIGEPQQDLLFERCLINGKRGYRIRPFNIRTGRGGHGDDTLEIASQWIPNLALGAEVEIGFFRD